MDIKFDDFDNDPVDTSNRISPAKSEPLPDRTASSSYGDSLTNVRDALDRLERISKEDKPAISPWTTGFAFTTLLFAFLWLSTFFSPGPGPGPGPGPEPGPGPAGEVYVAVWYDADAMRSYTIDQREALQSPDISSYIQSKATDYKKLGVGEDLSGLPEVYQKMADMHKTGLPWITIVRGDRNASEQLTSGSQVKQLMDKWGKK